MLCKRDLAIAVAVDPVEEPPWARRHLVTSEYSVTIRIPGRKVPIHRGRWLR
jgi:hypothetical protein